jgi:hypothetical protein
MSGEAIASDPRTMPVVTDAGEPPRIKLRYRPEPGATVRLEQITRIEQRVENKNGVLVRKQRPTWKILMTSRVESVNGEGEIEMSLTYDEVSIIEHDSMTEAQRDDLLERARGLNFRAEIRCTSLGEVLSLEIKTAADGDPNLKKLFEGMGDGILTLVHSLPQEAVGVGATWANDRSLIGGGTGTTTSVIESLRAGKVKIASKSSGDFPGVRPPNTDPSKPLDVLGGTLTGEQLTMLSVKHPGAVEQMTTTTVTTRMQGPNNQGELVAVDMVVETNAHVRVLD